MLSTILKQINVQITIPVIILHLNKDKLRDIDSFDSPSEENFSQKLSMPGDVRFLF